MKKNNKDIENKYYVYCYLDPRKSGEYLYGDFCFKFEPFYVGKGTGARMYDHLKFASGIKKNKSPNMHMINRIKNILKDGTTPEIIKVSDLISESDALFIEDSLISQIGRRDKHKGTLVNLQNNGEISDKLLAIESREKISKSLMGHVPWNKGRTGIYSEETRASISAKLTGRKGTPLTEYQKKICSLTHKNKIVSEETRNKSSKSHMGKQAWNKGLVGAQVAWNKGLHRAVKTYQFILNKDIIKIDDLKTYCNEMGLCYSLMIRLNSGKSVKYKNYKRYEDSSCNGR